MVSPDSYSITVVVHSVDAVSFDWLDGALFFQVISVTPMEGVANLDATVTARNMGSGPKAPNHNNHGVGSCVT